MTTIKPTFPKETSLTYVRTTEAGLNIFACSNCGRNKIYLKGKFRDGMERTCTDCDVKYALYPSKWKGTEDLKAKAIGINPKQHSEKTHANGKASKNSSSSVATRKPVIAGRHKVYEVERGVTEDGCDYFILTSSHHNLDQFMTCYKLVVETIA